MRAILAALLFILCAHVVRAQCSAPGCEEATAAVLTGKATARAILTANAPPPPPPMIVVTRETTRDVQVTVMATVIVSVTVVATATPAPTAQATAVVTVEPSATPATPQTQTQMNGDERISPGGFAAMAVVALVALTGAAYLAYRFIFPKRHDDRGEQWVQTKKRK